MRLRRLVLLFLLLPSLLLAAPVPQFGDGERWCAVGDSITHGGSYHRLVYLYYATRFPERQIDMWNCGISGDSAGGALNRSDHDILRHKPTVASIMLGMNDVSRGLYNEGFTAPDLQARRDGAINAHLANMRALATKLKAAGVRLIFITPSIYDDTSTMDKPNAPGVNAALGRCAEGAKALAAELGGSVVDFHGAMSALNAKVQAADPQATIVGGDRIHPGDAGHLVMAYLFLRAQGVPQLVADIRVDAAGRSEVSFERTENALPYPLPGSCAPGLAWVPFQEELNQERLAVAGLPAGRYQLSIDDQPISAWTAAELAAGVNLALCTNTPQYQQALAVAKLDEQRFGIARTLRTVDMVDWRLGHPIGDLTPFDWATGVQKLIDDPRNAGWNHDRYVEYAKLKPQQAEMLARLDELVKQMRAEARPKPHRYTIKPAP